MLQFIKLVWDRLTSPTPEFHAKFRNLMAGVVTVLSVLLTLQPDFIPADWYKYVEFAIAAAGGMGIYAQTTSTKH